MHDIVAIRTGKPLGDVLREAAGDEPVRNPVKTYEMADFKAWRGLEAIYAYAAPDMNVIELVVIRFIDGTTGKKSFRQATPYGMAYRMVGCDGPSPLYNRTRVRDSERVVVVEGEKAVHALHAIGIVATTCAGGSNGGPHADWSVLAGKKCYLWPDNDAGGQKHMDYVSGVLQRLTPPASVHRIDVDALMLPPKGDVVEYLESLADNRIDAQAMVVEDVLADATRVGGRGLRARIDDVASGKYTMLASGFMDLDFWTRFLVSGTVTVLCSPPGTGKSFMLLQMMEYLRASGKKIALYELEDTTDDHLNRMLAQLEGNNNIEDPRWQERRIQDYYAASDKHADALDAMRACMTEAPGRAPTYPQILEWLATKLADGCEVIAIDPVTVIDAGTKRYIADQDFLIQAKAMVRDVGARLVLVSHSKTGTSDLPSMDSVAGGASFVRFAHTCLWLRSEDDEDCTAVKTRDGKAMSVHSNRSLICLKARKGPGDKIHLAMQFDRNELCFRELGVVCKGAKHE